jgi:two-component system sensor histidine kinase PilS (NtrC family)
VYSVFVLGVACATVALARLVPGGEPAARGARLREVTLEVADLRGLNQVIVDSIQSGLITTDADGHILYANRFGETILGRSSDSLRGSLVAEVFGSPCCGRPSCRRAPPRARSRASSSPTGTPRDEESSSASRHPLATQEPLRRGCLVVFQDLTEIRRLEEQVRTKEKLAAVGEMAAQLAHEIRNPLGSIRGSAQVLTAEPALGEEQGRLLDIISRESKRLSDTLNRFLYQARTPASPRHAVDILPVIESAVTLLRNGNEVGPTT